MNTEKVTQHIVQDKLTIIETLSIDLIQAMKARIHIDVQQLMRKE